MTSIRKRPLSETFDGRMRNKFGKFGSIPISSDRSIFQKDVKAHFGCVNSVEFSHNQYLLASGGDDTRVLVWSVSDMIGETSPKPIAVMNTKHMANIFAYTFSQSDDRVYSGGNDGLLILHDLETKDKIRCWHSRGAVYNICCSPIDMNLVAASRDNGHVAFHDLRSKDSDPSTIIRMASPMSSAYSGQFNPEIPHIFAVGSDNEGLAFYDTRNLKKKLVDLQRIAEKVMYAEFNSTGQRIALNPFKDYPIVIDLIENRIWRLRDKNYKSLHTIKSVHFAEDDVVMIGGDDFGIYSWRIPQTPPENYFEGFEIFEDVNEATSILRGHRSIVNHVRYNDKLKVLASCGIEKIVKLWSQIPINNSTCSPNLRALGSSSGVPSIIGDDDETGVSNQNDSIEEDIVMLRHFDRLILRTRNREMGDPASEAHLGMISSDEDEDLPEILDEVSFGGYSDRDDEDEDDHGGSTDENDQSTEEYLIFGDDIRTIRRLNSPSTSHGRDPDPISIDGQAEEDTDDSEESTSEGPLSQSIHNLNSRLDARVDLFTNQPGCAVEIITQWPPQQEAQSGSNERETKLNEQGLEKKNS